MAKETDGCRPADTVRKYGLESIYRSRQLISLARPLEGFMGPLSNVQVSHSIVTFPTSIKQARWTVAGTLVLYGRS